MIPDLGRGRLMAARPCGGTPTPSPSPRKARRTSTATGCPTGGSDITPGLTNVLLGLNSNYDGDPGSDVLEYCMGTDPTNPASYLRLAIEPAPDGRWEVTLRAEPGRDYRRQRAEDLSVWSPAAPWGYGNGQGLIHALPPPAEASSQAFFRLEIR